MRVPQFSGKISFSTNTQERAQRLRDDASKFANKVSTMSDEAALHQTINISSKDNDALLDFAKTNQDLKFSFVPNDSISLSSDELIKSAFKKPIDSQESIWKDIQPLWGNPHFP